MMTPKRRKAVSARTMDAVSARRMTARVMWCLRPGEEVDVVNAWMREDKASVAVRQRGCQPPCCKQVTPEHHSNRDEKITVRRNKGSFRSPFTNRH